MSAILINLVFCLHWHCFLIEFICSIWRQLRKHLQVHFEHFNPWLSPIKVWNKVVLKSALLASVLFSNE